MDGGLCVACGVSRERGQVACYSYLLLKLRYSTDTRTLCGVVVVAGCSWVVQSQTAEGVIVSYCTRRVSTVSTYLTWALGEAAEADGGGLPRGLPAGCFAKGLARPWRTTKSCRRYRTYRT